MLHHDLNLEAMSDRMKIVELYKFFMTGEPNVHAVCLQTVCTLSFKFIWLDHAGTWQVGLV